MFVMFAVAELNVPAVTVPDALIEFATVRFVNVPTVVMLGWFAVVMLALNVAASIAPVTLNVCKPVILVMFACAELKVPAVTVPDTVKLLAKMLPLTVKAVRLPKLVILFNVLGASVPLKVPPLISPGTVKLLNVPLNAFTVDAAIVTADRLAASIDPDTVRLVSVPSVVMFGWFAVVMLALKVAASIAPVTLNVCSPVILVIVASAELKVPALTVPVTVKF